MRPRLKYALWALAAVAGVLVLGALAIFLFVDAEFFRDTLQTRLEAALGRDVELGAMSVSIFPTLGLEVDDIGIGPRHDVEEPPLLTAEQLRVGARLGPLLRKRLEVTKVVLVGPELTVVRMADGTWQPDRLLAGDGGTDPETVEATGAGGTAPLSIDELRIEGATLRVEVQKPDGSLESAMSLDSLSVRLTLDGSGPFTVALAAELPEAGGAGLTMEVDGDGLFAGPEVPVTAAIRFEIDDLDPAAMLDRVATIAGSDAIPLDAWTSESMTASARLTASPSGAPVTIQDIEIAGIRVDLAKLPGGVPVIVDDLRVTLDRLPFDQPAAVGIEGAIRDDGGRFRATGSIGPVPDDPGNLPIELELTADDIALGPLAGLVPPSAEVDLASATVQAVLGLKGAPLERIDVTTDATLAGVTVSRDAPDGGRIEVPLDARMHGTVGVIGAGDRIELADLAIEPAGSGKSEPLTLRGSVDLTQEFPNADLRLLPTRIVADDLAAWAALVMPDLPLAFSSPDPIEVEFSIRGPIGTEELPDVRGRAALSGFTFRHPSMTQPAEQVRGVVRLDGDRIRLNDLHAVVGSSDVSGDIVVLMNAEPVVNVELVSHHADFWELFSFVSADESNEGVGTAPTDEDGSSEILDLLRVEGTVRIDDGLLRTLRFKNLTSGIRIAERVLTLAPLSMELYGGSFEGRIVQDMRVTPSTLDFAGKASGVSLDPFLAENLGLGGLVSGSIGTDLSLQLQAGDLQTIASSLTGGGSIQVADGNISKLEVLQPLSKVAGMFGEQTLKSLSGELAGQGTSFRTLETRLAFDGGRALFDDAVLETPYVRLEGAGAVDLAGALMDGRLAAVFSPEISAAMRGEGSRAAQVFMDSRGKQVRVPFSIKGPIQEPTVGVDWQKAAETTLERTLTGELNKLLGGRKKETARAPKPAPSSGAESASEPTPPGSSTPPAGGQSLAASEAPSSAAAPSQGPVSDQSGTIKVKIREALWGGSFIGPDLTVKYVVRGVGVERASIDVVDAGGQRVAGTGRIGQVSSAIEAAAAGEEIRVSTGYKVDGKRLLVAKFPLTVTVTAIGGGNEASVSLSVPAK